MDGSSLDDFLAAHMQRPWKWGETDCCCFASEWIEARTGLDPMATFRPHYRSRASALALFERRGGLCAVMSERMAEMGFRPTSEPDHGDVGIVRAPVRTNADILTLREVAAIMVSSRWICRSQQGIASAPFELVKAWRIP